VPGAFTVSISKRIDGVLTPLCEPQTFTVESLSLASLPAKDRNELLAFQKKAGELQRAMMGAGSAAREAIRQLQFVKKALLDTLNADPKLEEKARTIEHSLQNIQTELYGDSTIQRRSEPTSPGGIHHPQDAASVLQIQTLASLRSLSLR